MRLLALALEPDGLSGVYDDAQHGLGSPDGAGIEALALNRKSVAELAGADAGTTIQLFADPVRLIRCYEHHESLLWRDAGSVIATLCLVAEALGLAAVPLGRIGTNIVQAYGLPGYRALGAVHLGTLAD